MYRYNCPLKNVLKKCKTSRERIGMDLDSMDFMSASLGEKWMAETVRVWEHAPPPSQSIFECPTGREAWAEFQIRQNNAGRAGSSACVHRAYLKIDPLYTTISNNYDINAIANCQLALTAEKCAANRGLKLDGVRKNHVNGETINRPTQPSRGQMRKHAVKGVSYPLPPAVAAAALRNVRGCCGLSNVLAN